MNSIEFIPFNNAPLPAAQQIADEISQLYCLPDESLSSQIQSETFLFAEPKQIGFFFDKLQPHSPYWVCLDFERIGGDGCLNRICLRFESTLN